MRYSILAALTLPEQITTIAVAMITTVGGGYFALKSKRPSTLPKKPTTVDEYHSIVTLLQNELTATAKRHADEIRHLQNRLDDLSSVHDKNLIAHRTLYEKFTRSLAEISRLRRLLRKNKVPYGKSLLQHGDDYIAQ